MIYINPHFYPKYKNIHYHYDNELNRWSLYDNYYSGCLMMFNSYHYRLDQCFEIFLKEFGDLVK